MFLWDIQGNIQPRCNSACSATVTGRSQTSLIAVGYLRVPRTSLVVFFSLLGPFARTTDQNCTFVAISRILICCTCSVVRFDGVFSRCFRKQLEMLLVFAVSQKKAVVFRWAQKQNVKQNFGISRCAGRSGTAERMTAKLDKIPKFVHPGLQTSTRQYPTKVRIVMFTIGLEGHGWLIRDN